MSWKQRGAQRYYYRSDGRKKHYLGRGDAADYAASLDTAKRTEREQAAADHELTRRQFLVADHAVRSFVDMAATLIDAAFVTAGYYRHDRGPWRRRKNAATGDLT